MPISTQLKKRFFQLFKNIFFLSLVLSSCYIPKKYQKNKPFILSNSIKVNGGNFTKDEVSALKSRLNAQLDDSSKINVVDKYFIRHVYNNPPVFDTASAARSAKNMKASMVHLGYYRATVSYNADTVIKYKQQRVLVKYIVEPGKPTNIDTISYRLKKTELQELTMQNLDRSLIQQGKPVTKASVLGEISRLIDLYRNNGYYKITAEELKMRGDTSLEALTSISDDPFEQLRLLAEAQQKKDSPKIKLGLVLNPPADSNRLKKYYINNIYILPDYRPGDSLNDPSLTERVTKDLHIIRYHNKILRSNFLTRNVFVKKGDLYRQTDFYKTLNSFSRAGVWQSTNIEVMEVKDKDSINKINLIIQLIPTKQFSRELGIEASYSATSNTNSVTAANAGNLLGLSGNISKTNRNMWKEGIKMTTALRLGFELNLKPDSNKTKNIINSNDVSLSNTLVIPRFILVPKFISNSKRVVSPQTFANINLSYINRINLFKLQSVNFAIGYTWRNRKNAQWLFKPLNIEFTKLFNESAEFTKTLNDNPFLRYSFNTALVAGASAGYTAAWQNKRKPAHSYGIKINIEESGLTLLPPLPLRPLKILTTNLRQYLKTDIEFTHTRNFKKSSFAFRFFGGVGIASKEDTTLPFFKQYFGGGSNSMRGWPVRGIGRGSQLPAQFNTSSFNDRTGDIQLEINTEYRYNIAQIIPNTLVLKGALFIDAGNVWNLRNSKPNGAQDSAQFKIKNLWRETGISAGTGFRFDFNYFLLRFDFGFRFKRPELADYNNGWKVPALGFDDVLKKIFTRGNNDEYRKWRYENFNFTIGINYPF
jgi:outer membrane protein insertion porin family